MDSPITIALDLSASGNNASSCPGTSGQQFWLFPKQAWNKCILYKTSECRALYQALQVYVQRYIQHPNVKLYIRTPPPPPPPHPPGLYSALNSTSECRALYSARSKFRTIFNIWMYSSLFGSTGLYSALDSNPNVELYIQPSRSIFNAKTNIRTALRLYYLYSTSECGALYTTLHVNIVHYITSECRALYSTLQVYIQLYIQPSRSKFSARSKNRM